MAPTSTLMTTAEYKRHRTRMIAYGQWQPYRDAKPVREHIEALRFGYGLSCEGIGGAAGISGQNLRIILEGDLDQGRPIPETVRTATSEAILAVRFDLDAFPQAVHVSAAGTRRRIQALAAIGHPVAAQASEVGMDLAPFHRLLGRDKVTVGTARTVRDLYRAWSAHPPEPRQGTRRAVTIARKKGWQPPAAWEDEWLDLADEALQAHLDAIVSGWSFDEVRACAQSRRSRGDRSPLTVAGTREYYRRSKLPSDEREAAHVG